VRSELHFGSHAIRTDPLLNRLAHPLESECVRIRLHSDQSGESLLEQN
jgi:hypothetical protein